MKSSINKNNAGLISKKSKEADPFSTPARRRRIIDVFAKSTLRHYCLSACQRVARKRLENWAAIRIQCLIRRHAAKLLKNKMLFHLRNSAATKIQSVIRMKISTNLAALIRKDKYNRRAKDLVTKIESMYLAAKQRAERKVDLAKQRDRKFRKQNLAAIEIQRIYRGFLSRQRLQQLRAFKERCKAAAIVIQSKSRQLIASRRVHLLRRRMAAIALILSFLMRWRYKRKKLKEKAEILIRRLFRYLISRRIFRRLLLIKRRESEVLIGALGASEVAVIESLLSTCLPLPPEPVAARRTLDIHIDLHLDLFNTLSGGGPLSVLQWSMDHFILRLNLQEEEEGRPGDGGGVGSQYFFSNGRVLQQVVDSVTDALDSQRKEKDKTELDDDKEHVVTLFRNADMIENMSQIESEWLQKSGLGRLGWGEICEGHANRGVRLTVLQHSTEQKKILLKIVSFQSGSVRARNRTGESLFQIDFQELFHPLEVESEVNLFLVCCPELQNTVKDSDEDVRFRLNNALVFVSCVDRRIVSDMRTDSTTQQIPDTPNENPPANEATEDEMEIMMEMEREERKERPLTAAVMRILLRDRTPSPIVDYSHFAAIIQRAFRRRLALLHAACRRLQAFLRRFLRFRRLVLVGWRPLVLRLLQRAKRAAVTIQCFIRRQRAIKLRDKLRKEKLLQEEKDRFSFGNDYELDDLEGIWAAFGFPIAKDCENEKTVFKNGKGLNVKSMGNIVCAFDADRFASHLSLFQGTNKKCESSSAGHSDRKSKLKNGLASSSSFTSPFALREVLSVLGLPNIPPHCVRPDLHCLLTVPAEEILSNDNAFYDPSSVLAVKVNTTQEENVLQDLGQVVAEYEKNHTDVIKASNEIEKTDSKFDFDLNYSNGGIKKEMESKRLVVHPVIIELRKSFLTKASFSPVESYYGSRKKEEKVNGFQFPFGEEIEDESFGDIDEGQDMTQINFPFDLSEQNDYISPLLEKISRLKF